MSNKNLMGTKLWFSVIHTEANYHQNFCVLAKISLLFKDHLLHYYLKKNANYMICGAESKNAAKRDWDP